MRSIFAVLGLEAILGKREFVFYPANSVAAFLQMIELDDLGS